MVAVVQRVLEAAASRVKAKSAALAHVNSVFWGRAGDIWKTLISGRKVVHLRADAEDKMNRSL
jgi:hypothetical protein